MIKKLEAEKERLEKVWDKIQCRMLKTKTMTKTDIEILENSGYFTEGGITQIIRDIEIIKSAIMDEVGKCETSVIYGAGELHPCREANIKDKCLKCQGKLEMIE
jgi:hypothetical protein